MHKFAVLDFETTGLDPTRHGIIEFGLIILDKELNELSRFQSFVYQPIIPFSITDLTGIETGDVMYAMSSRQAEQLIMDLTLGCKLVAHNAPFELSFMPEAYQPDFLCTKSIANILEPKERSSLGFVCDRYGIELGENAHRAMADAEATAQLLREFRKQGGLHEWENILVQEVGRPVKYFPKKLKEIRQKETLKNG
jgi:DNA polymerase III subunit epsilon